VLRGGSGCGGCCGLRLPKEKKPGPRAVKGVGKKTGQNKGRHKKKLKDGPIRNICPSMGPAVGSREKITLLHYKKKQHCKAN